MMFKLVFKRNTLASPHWLKEVIDDEDVGKVYVNYEIGITNKGKFNLLVLFCIGTVTTATFRWVRQRLRLVAFPSCCIRLLCPVTNVCKSNTL